jgi:hypothetical protein
MEARKQYQKPTLAKRESLPLITAADDVLISIIGEAASG